MSDLNTAALHAHEREQEALDAQYAEDRKRVTGFMLDYPEDVIAKCNPMDVLALAMDHPAVKEAMPRRINQATLAFACRDFVASIEGYIEDVIEQ